MNELSALILKLAEQALVQPTEKSSREAVAATLLLAQVAVNRAVDPFGGDQAGHYNKVLKALQKENPKCLRELKSSNCEALIQGLTKLKRAHYPTDDRLIHVCGLTPENRVHVEWKPREPHVTN